MKISSGVGYSLALTLSAMVAAAQEPGGSPGAPAAGGELRWTPHRAAVSQPATNVPAAAAVTGATPSATPARGSAPTAIATGGQTAPQTASPAPRVATAAPAAPSTRPAQPPASVGLPAGVPAAVPPRGPSPRQASAPRTARLDDWESPNRVPGPLRTTANNGGGIRLPDIDQINLFRSPQGDAGRPMLAAEGSPRRPAPRRAAPADGGLAPRFSPATQRSAAPRGDRLAMNDADGLSSVVSRAPQAAVIDGAAPGRPSTSGGMPAAALPQPSAAPADEPSIVIETLPSGTREYVGAEAYGESGLPEGYFPTGSDPDMLGADGGMWMGNYPTELHVESFYDDPFACEEGDGCLPLWYHDGRICAWLRQFGRPYYGWRWYRDFTASAGVSAFENQSNLGLRGNFGVNEYLNWAMPFWNAFGVGWQVGVRGIQTNFNSTTVNDSAYGKLQSAGREQVFLTTGFFTRAFEGRGLQGGAVYDYLTDTYYESVSISQVRGELSYVWGYHELGFWGAFAGREQQGFFSPALQTNGVASTVDLYTAFYRLHFGDANEARVWGGASGDGQGIIGASVRAPMSRSWALEGTFTYLMPSKSQTVQLDPLTSVTFTPQAWNVGVNLVWYPAGRARRSLASPYRPLFDVADNGSMIRALAAQPTP